MTTCRRCGKFLPIPPSVLDRYTPRGLFWLVLVVASVSGMAILLGLSTVTSLLESELPYNWRFLLVSAFCTIIILAIALSGLRVFKARRLAHYCPDCAAAMIAKKLSRPEESGAHKIRTKKE